MRKILTTFLTFVIFYAVLSIEIKGQTIFSYLFNLTAPLTKVTQEKTKQFIQATAKEGKILGNKLINNSNPKNNSQQKTDHVSDADQAELDQLMKEYH